MADSKYFGIPFATSGDKATIPEEVQPSGLISWTQGFGPDYERDPATDPLAKRVPRDETNEYLFQVTNAIKFLQLYGTPEWYPLDDAGDPVSYPLTARVRHDDGTGMKVWQSIVAGNTAEPGTDATKWIEAPRAATQAEVNAGLLSNVFVSPLTLAKEVPSYMAARSGGSTQTTPSGVFTTITTYGLISTNFRGASTFSSGVLTVGDGDEGLWILTLSARQDVGGVNGFAMQVTVNGVALGSDGGQTAGAGAIGHAGAAVSTPLTVGDIVRWQLVQTNGSPVTFTDYTVSAARLGSA